MSGQIFGVAQGLPGKALANDEDAAGRPESGGDDLDDLPTVVEVIEELGIGWAQMKVAIFAGGVWFADGSELLLITSVTQAVSADWQLSAFERAFIVSLVFIGVLIGNLISGPFGDLHGRKLPIIISFASIFIFSLLSAVTWDFASLSTMRFFVGVSFGMGQPSFQSLASESVPASWRALVVGMGQPLFAFGEMYSAVLLMADDPYLEHLHWRSLVMLGAIPALVFFFAALLFLNQSPLYLDCCGRYEETRVVLESMRADNAAMGVSTAFRRRSLRVPREDKGGQGDGTLLAGAVGFLQQLGAPFGGGLLMTTAALSYSTIVLNLFHYGTMYALPQIIGEMDMGGTPALELFVGSVWELFGYIVGIACSMRFARKPVIGSYLFLATVSILCFVLAAPSSNAAGAGGITHVALMAGFYGMKFFFALGFIVVYLFVVEAYPTVSRVSGTAICLSSGRLAAILAPGIFEGLLSATGSYQVFFYTMVAMGIVNYFVLQLMPHDTAGALLRDGCEPPRGAEGGAAGEYGATC